MIQTFNTRQREPVNPATDGGTGTAGRSGSVADAIAPVRHQHGGQPAGIIFIVRLWMAFYIGRRSSRGIGAMIGIARSVGDL